MPRYGTSEHEAFTSTGRLKLIAETNEVCNTCDGSANGPTNFSIIRETPSAVELICPNCGTQKTVFPSEVKRKLSPAEQARRDAMIAAATAKPMPAPAPAPAAPVKKAAKKPAPKVQKKPAPKARPVKKAAKKGKKRAL